jgi:hypothetical protein
MGLAVVLVLAVMLLATRARRWQGGQVMGPAMANPDPSLEELTGAATAEAPRMPRSAVTADGWTFLETGDAVRLLPPVGNADPVRPILSGASDLPDHFRVLLQVGDVAALRRGRDRLPGEILRRGDLRIARIAAGGQEGWRLEALGRDGEYEAWGFDDEDEASQALALIEELVLVPHGMAVAEDMDRSFETARRRAMMTEAEMFGFPAPDDDPGRLP